MHKAGGFNFKPTACVHYMRVSVCVCLPLLTGLELIVDLRQDDYAPALEDTAGVRIVIHQQRTMAFPEDDGVTVGPGHFTSVAFKQVK